MIRFWLNGWIEKLYLEPAFHFHYLGFEFINVPGKLTYLLFIVAGLSAFSVAIGFKYRLSIILFFLSFGYIELMDKTTYLNHYYFISIVSFMLIWLPAHHYFSVDAFRNKEIRNQFIKNWQIDSLKMILAIVYIYAGLAKLNADWMLNAMPLKIWLPTKFNIPLIGGLMHETWVHYLFSWAGAFYDILIVFFLMWHKTRIGAFAAVVVFHVLTRILFPIGMFPFIMIAGTLIFFSPAFHEKIISGISRFMNLNKSIFDNGIHLANNFLYKAGKIVLVIFICFQILFPLRFLLYPGNVFWTEQGYRFAWRVMLMEKTGSANFKIVDGESGNRFYVQNEDFLTNFQQKQMSTQADFIIEYAHYLGDHFKSQGHQNVEVYVENYVSLNGRQSQLYIDPEIDLMKLENNIFHKKYILPLNE